MVRFILIHLLILFTNIVLASGVFPENNIYSDSVENFLPTISDSLLDVIPINKDIVFCGTTNSYRNQCYREVTLTTPGTLSDIVGAEINLIDSIVVKGTLNDDDFKTLWSASFYGSLSIINLEHASVENKTIPSRAFWHQDEQLNDDGTISVIGLRKILLPNQIESIGDLAFSYVIHLEFINIPSGLRDLGIYCFSDCVSLKGNPLVIPEGVAEIPGMCFRNCKSLDAIALPSTIKNIEEGAFYNAKIKYINFPDGLLSIGNCAFYSSDLEVVNLPSSCLEFLGTHHFALNYRLKKINIPFGVCVIPNCFVYNDLELEEIEIPTTIKVIGKDALSTCMELGNIALHDGVEKVDSNAFWYCSSIKQLVLPSSLTYLGGASCQYLQSLEAIYCSALVPPVCDEDPANKGKNHTFGLVSGEPGCLATPNDIPVYVPVGTSSQYASAYGWNYFTNFIETDEFPSTSVWRLTTGKQNENKEIYDLTGRKVLQPVAGGLYISNGKKIVYHP